MSSIRSFLRSAAVLLVLGTAACAPDEEPEVVEEQPAAAPAEAAASGPDLPDTTEAALWSYLQEVDYQQNWRLWPGTDRLYEGTEPHGMLLTTYANPLAYDALTNAAAALPPGSIIVKENYMPDSTLAAITTMYNVQGYNPEHEDWFFAKHDANGVVEVAGRAPMCQSCHQQAPRGYIYTEVPR